MPANEELSPERKQQISKLIATKHSEIRARKSSWIVCPESPNPSKVA
jgi:hypothetical protein